MSKKYIPTALRIASTIAWGVTPEYLAIIEDICAGITNPAAVATELGRPLENTRAVEVRDGVAIIPVHSVIFRRADMINSLSGNSASVQTIAKDFTTALNNPAVKAIIFDFDTPGGEVNGIAELASIVYAARGQKPIKAYVGDCCASAGYWLAVACDEIVMYRTARVGSIGIMAIADVSTNINRKRFTSKQSPNKNAPANTSLGESLIQKELDTAGAMFIEDVSMMRGVSEDTVLADFGQGGVLYAADAIAVRMADRLGTFEELLTELQQGLAVDNRVMSAFSSAAMTATNKNIEVRKINLYD